MLRPTHEQFGHIMKQSFHNFFRLSAKDFIRVLNNSKEAFWIHFTFEIFSTGFTGSWWCPVMQLESLTKITTTYYCLRSFLRLKAKLSHNFIPIEIQGFSFDAGTDNSFQNSDNLLKMRGTSLSQYVTFLYVRSICVISHLCDPFHVWLTNICHLSHTSIRSRISPLGCSCDRPYMGYRCVSSVETEVKPLNLLLITVCSRKIVQHSYQPPWFSNYWKCLGLR